MAEATAKGSDNATPRCNRCGYLLKGLRNTTCPECGTKFDPLAPLRHPARRFLFAAAVMMLVMFGPYAWLLTIDYPWNAYRWSWIHSWLGLPLLLPAKLVSHWAGVSWDLEQFNWRFALSSASMALCFALAWMGSRRWWMLLLVAAVAAMLSILNSIGFYHAFRM